MVGKPKKGRRFGGSSAHQKAMMGNLVASLIAAEAIVTTEAKAKAMRPVAEKIITKAKKGGLHNHRQIIAFLRDQEIADKLIEDVGTYDEFKTEIGEKALDWIHSKLQGVLVCHAFESQRVKSKKDAAASYLVNHSGSKIDISSVYVKISE